MHEYSLVEALVRRVEAEAEARQAVAVHGLVVSIGELAGVDPELFRTAWETFRQGTRCERTAIEIRYAPATWSCPRCGLPIERGAPLRCPPCGEPARLSERADALILESIDMEVP